MSKIKFFNNQVEVNKKKIILRTDFNVPIINGKIQDKTRINLCIPFIKDLLNKKAKLMLISHLGRPKNGNEKELSLKPIYNYLKQKLSEKIFFHTDKIDQDTKKKISF